jgi:hypothetical protein
LTLLPYYANTEPSYWLYTLKAENRDGFIRMMNESGVAASTLHHRSDTHSVLPVEVRASALDKFYGEFVHIPCGWWSARKTANDSDLIKKGW